MSNRPIYRVTYRDKDTGDRYDVGAVWPPRKKIGGLLGGLTPRKESEGGQYPKMRMADAIERAERGEGFLDIWDAAPRKEREPRAEYYPDEDTRGDEFSDDIPF